MHKDIRVLIVEDDPFARDMMSLLLTRDWRTRVIGEAINKKNLLDFLAQGDSKVDVVVLDTEIPGAPILPFELAAMTQEMSASPAILFTGTKASIEPLKQVLKSESGGYVLKGELLYALAAAVANIHKGHYVITPSVLGVIDNAAFPSGLRILDGRKQWSAFTPREKEVIRLAMIFNLAIRDMADELVLSQGWVSELVSTIYMKLGLREILSGEAALENYFTDEAVLEHCREITKRGEAVEGERKLRKAPWMSTLAFHLLTIPEVKIL
ncbi:MAG: response regulator transcription factor [Anaerolineales bacterium]|nr:response regulator transcription factor [Chloroflexota bacterium]MBL6983498.1 response regulator transcription factor [Anaerolineales bacterium]